MYRWLLILSVSYWYCLPVASTRAVGYTEFRGYDFLLLGTIGMLLFRYWARVRTFFKSDPPGLWLMRFTLWATVMAGVTISWYVAKFDLETAGVTGMQLFHLWGFVLAYAAFRLFAKTRRRCLGLLDVFLGVGILEALIICFQSVHLIPRFWSSLYDVYGDKVFCGTLGMNRTLPGHAMILLFAVAFTYIYNWRVVGPTRLMLSMVAAVMALAGILVSGSRTAWVVFLAFLASMVFHRKLMLPMVAVAGLGAAFFLAAAPAALKESVVEMYDWKVSGKLEHAESDAMLDQFQAVDAGQYQTWLRGIGTLVKKPWVAAFGVGFTNYRMFDPKGSAHNMYITLLVELGVVGFFFYTNWLRQLWLEGRRLIQEGQSRGASSAKLFCPAGMIPLLVALCVSLSAGEILYVYRPCFAFLGMFLFVWGTATNHALVFGNSANRRFRSLPARRAFAFGRRGAASQDLPGWRDGHAADRRPQAGDRTRNLCRSRPQKVRWR